MQTTSLFRRAAALALTLVLAVSASLAGFATYDMPIQTVSDTESVYLFNLDTGKPILDQNAGQSRYIASLTKMMTARTPTTPRAPMTCPGAWCPRRS